MQETRVDDVLNLLKKWDILLNTIKNSPHRCKGSNSSQDRLSIILFGVLSDQPNVLLPQMLADIGSVWSDIFLEDSHYVLEGGNKLLVVKLGH